MALCQGCEVQNLPASCGSKSGIKTSKASLRSFERDWGELPGAWGLLSPSQRFGPQPASET